MTCVEVAWHDPVDMHNLVDLVYRSADQVEAHCLHQEHLHIYGANLASRRQSLERKTAVVLVACEHKFEEGNDTHLFVQIVHFLDDGWEAGDKLLVLFNSLFEFLDLAAA